MAEPPTNGSTNGAYIVAADGIRISIRRTVLTAIKKMIDEKRSGSVTISFREGGIAAVEDRTVYPNS